MKHNDANRKPIVSGLYKHKYFSNRLIFIDLENDSYEIINATLAETKLKGKISDKVRDYLEGYKQVNIQAYIDHYQKKADFFKSKLEQLAQSKVHPFGEWGKAPLLFP